MIKQIKAFVRGFREGVNSERKAKAQITTLPSSKIIRAAKAGDLELARKLIEQNPAFACGIDEDGHTPLHYAAYYGHSDVAALLIANHANVNARDRIGNTPLHSSAIRGRLNQDWKNVVELLLANKADVHATNAIGRTPLQEAEYLQDEDVAALLRPNFSKAAGGQVPGRTGHPSPMTWRKYFAVRGMLWATSFTTIAWLIIVVLFQTGYLVWPGLLGITALGLLGWMGGYLYGVAVEPKRRPVPVEEVENGTPCVACEKRIANDVKLCPFCGWTQPR